ncbi:Metallo-dependent phosphatase-like protein [Aspergillus pseudotamarii]|uniref:Metallo-dependent phosphatase-like protein n=1 Tax=Aspergillus pseudotamarii TaxID=132259 RepID=A0A5N6SER2_ASPPS|nr:Metallo-dependent phosphatase-like protein [Aspergillus pseudotamarii]KAE8133206.1 Metallo-dependent phosphatase-like protein [Aspergillus pseudotamarii]
MSLFGKQGNSLDELLNRPRPSAWQQFMKQPCIFLARKLYTWQSTIAAQPVKDPVSIVCISDTHNSQPSLPDGDILIHAGDLTQSGSLKELQVTLNWLRAQPHATKIVIAGNHDLCLGWDINRLKAEDETPDWGDIVYLQDSEVSITCNNGRHLNIYGSPYSPRHGNWTFQYSRSEDFWGGRVPANIDILITHTPPRAHLDLLNLGCTYLLRTLWRVRPRLHVFGHVHEGAGTEWLQFDALQSAYERTVVAGGGIWNVIYTMKEFVGNCFRPTTEAKCLLVNASIVGGLRDHERRQPVKLFI